MYLSLSKMRITNASKHFITIVADRHNTCLIHFTKCTESDITKTFKFVNNATHSARPADSDKTMFRI